jgi:protein-L-isoaspartate(D-aspartate) O-methyltransferase
VDYATQRKNMVESQVRPSDVTDRRIIRAMLEIPREAFAPEGKREIAYMDGSVALTGSTGQRRELLAPRTLAKLIQAAEIDDGGTVLIIGAVTGYSAAIASKLAGSVVALECDPAFVSAAGQALAGGVSNVSCVAGPLPAGWQEGAPYDAIVIEGAVAVVPEALLQQLKDGGRLVAILGQGASGKAVVWTRIDGTFGSQEVFDAAALFVPGFEPITEFAF